METVEIFPLTASATATHLPNPNPRNQEPIVVSIMKACPIIPPKEIKLAFKSQCPETTTKEIDPDVEILTIEQYESMTNCSTRAVAPEACHIAQTSQAQAGELQEADNGQESLSSSFGQGIVDNSGEMQFGEDMSTSVNNLSTFLDGGIDETTDDRASSEYEVIELSDNEASPTNDSYNSDDDCYCCYSSFTANKSVEETESDQDPNRSTETGTSDIGFNRK